MAGRGCAVRLLGRGWGWVMAKVYVSSTIADLKQVRQAVVDWLRAARHQAVDSYTPDSEMVRDSRSISSAMHQGPGRTWAH